MPDPKKLKVGDRVKFVSLPEEWNDPKYWVHEDTVAFMKAMIARSWSSRIREMHELGHPWIRARMKERGTTVYHG